MRIAALALLLVTLSACASPAPVTPPTPKAEGVSVARWAGLIAERQVELDDWYESWDGAVCSSLASSEFDCNTWLVSASYIALTNDIVIAGPSDPEALTYLGPVPAEIADLYEETIDLTSAAATAGEAWTAAECGIGNDSVECVGLAFKFESAMSAVRTKFAAWAPYL